MANECRKRTPNATTATGSQSINQIKIHQITRQINSVVLSFRKIKSILCYSTVANLFRTLTRAGLNTDDLRWRPSCVPPKTTIRRWLCISIWWAARTSVTITPNESLYASLFLIIYTIGNGYAHRSEIFSWASWCNYISLYFLYWCAIAWCILKFTI